MNNYQYFEYSKSHPEDLFDSFYAKDKVIIPKNSFEDNQLTKNNTALIEYITTFKVLTNLGKTLDDSDVEQVVLRIVDIMDNTDGINFSAFSQFFMVYNFTYSLYKTIKNQAAKMNMMYEILIKYCKERHDMYMSHGYSHTILQVMCDNYSHKRNSKSGIEKVLGMLEPFHLEHYTSCFGLDSKDDFYFLPDKGDKHIFEYFLKHYRLEMKSREIEQDKLPDIVFKHNGHYYICELKTMKEGGGGQNKQIVEMFNFIKFSEHSPNFHYIVFLDCSYSNILLNNMSPKVVVQRQDIEGALRDNPNNYFLNTKGMIKFINDVFSD